MNAGTTGGQASVRGTTYCEQATVPVLQNQAAHFQVANRQSAALSDHYRRHTTAVDLRSRVRAPAQYSPPRVARDCCASQPLNDRYRCVRGVSPAPVAPATCHAFAAVASPVAQNPSFLSPLSSLFIPSLVLTLHLRGRGIPTCRDAQ